MLRHGLQRLRDAIRRLRHRLRPKALILMYHRVAEVRSDPCLLAVRPSRFAEHMEVLRKHYHPVPLQQAARGDRPRLSRRREVVVTFDDGYADNLINAKPLLHRHEIPATVFVTGGQVGSDREFWWDELDRFLLQPGTLPVTLDLKIDGKDLRWELGKAAAYRATDQEKNLSWNLLRPDDPGPRQRLYRSICQLFFPLTDAEQRRVLEQIRLGAGAGPKGRDTHRTLTGDEVRQLADGGLVEVGAHTLTHPSLAAHSVAYQREEIQGSKRCLEEVVGRPVRSFAYPYGSPSHYGEETVSLVREAGFNRACSNFQGLLDATCDPLQQPRFMVFNWNGDEFARKLSEWFNDEPGARSK